MRRVLDRAAPLLASLLIRVLHASLRIRHVQPAGFAEMVEQDRRFILAFWHAHLLLMVYARYPKPILTMISKHRDGELIARTVRYFGAESARGSTTRGGSAALREMILAARRGLTLAITPDGPRGPRQVAQMGVVQVAQATGLPVVPVALIARRKTRLRSWDRFEIPHFFSRALYLYGDPIAVPRNLSREEMERKREEIETVLRALSERGETEFEAIWERGER